MSKKDGIVACKRKEEEKVIYKYSSSRQGQVNYFKFICGALSLICMNIIVNYKNMQRRDSLGLTTRIPRLSTGSTRKFKTRRRQSSFSSVSDVFADNGATKGQAGFSVS